MQTIPGLYAKSEHPSSVHFFSLTVCHTSLHLLVEQECKRPDLKIKLEHDVEELLARPSVSHGYYKE